MSYIKNVLIFILLTILISLVNSVYSQEVPPDKVYGTNESGKYYELGPGYGNGLSGDMGLGWYSTPDLVYFGPICINNCVNTPLNDGNQRDRGGPGACNPNPPSCGGSCSGCNREAICTQDTCNQAGCNCQWRRIGPDESELVGVTGTYCTDPCQGRNKTDCRNASNCSWGGEATGSCAGACTGFSGSAGCYDSCGNYICCSLPPPPVTNTPTPTLYPTVAIAGILREYNGTSCTNNISSNSLSINIVPQYPAGVTSVCTQNPVSGNPKTSYGCTVSFNNQTAQPTPAQNLTLNASASEYQSAYWTSNNTCGGSASNTIAVNVGVPVPTTTFNKDIFFNVISSWTKLRNLSFNGNSSLQNPLPLSISAYDGDDTPALRYFITGLGSEVGGVTSASTVGIGTAQASVNDWQAQAYTRQKGFTPSTFFDYVKSRKDYTPVKDPASFDVSALTQPGIYYVSGSISLSDAKNPSVNAVIIVNGNVTITGDFNLASAKSIAVLATGNITVSGSSTLYGIFVSDGTFDTGTGGGLKIKGNLSTGTLNNQRAQTNKTKPSLFIMNDPNAFINLLPYLSISKYDQTVK